MSVTPRDEHPEFDVRAVPAITNHAKNGDDFITRGHCLHPGCPFGCEGPEADRTTRLHTEKAHHPTVCRTELTTAHRRR